MQPCNVSLLEVLMVFLVVLLVISQAQAAAVECVLLDLCFWPGWRNEIVVHQHFERYLSAKAEHCPFSRDVLLWNLRDFLYIFHFSAPSDLFFCLQIVMFWYAYF